MSRSERGFSWLTLYVSARHGASFGRDVVF